MTSRQAWKKLGIDKTEDKRAIKRAYAARLKAIDPDADPKAFLALRDALQMANWDADSLAWGEPEEDEAEAFEGVEDAAPEPEPEPPADDFDRIVMDDQGRLSIRLETPTPADDADDATPEEQDARNIISNILWADAPAPDDAAHLVTATRELLEDPRMEQIGFAADTEEWFAWMLANNMERGEPVLGMVSQYFHWEPERHQIGGIYGTTEVAARAADLVSRGKLEQPTHEWHATFEKLKAPAGDKLGLAERYLHRSQVDTLLRAIRTHHPSIEWDLDRDHVALWDAIAEKKAAAHQRTGPSWWIYWIIGIGIVRLIISFAQT